MDLPTPRECSCSQHSDLIPLGPKAPHTFVHLFHFPAITTAYSVNYIPKIEQFCPSIPFPCHDVRHIYISKLWEQAQDQFQSEDLIKHPSLSTTATQHTWITNLLSRRSVLTKPCSTWLAFQKYDLLTHPLIIPIPAHYIWPIPSPSSPRN